MNGKPTELMQQLVRICKADGPGLDPFAGSGTNLVAAQLEGLSVIGIEITERYAALARERLNFI